MKFDFGISSLVFVWQIAAVEAVFADLAVGEGPIHQGDPVAGAGLGEDVADVVIDRAFANR